MKYLIGLSYGHHESSACLLGEDGNWTFAREEWYSRIKHDHRYPQRAISHLIKSCGDKNFHIVAACLHEKPLRTWLGAGFKTGLTVAHYMNKVRQLKQSNFSIHNRLKRDFRIPSEKIFFSTHHLSHHFTGLMLSTDYIDFGLVLDGYGEGSSGAVIEGIDDEIHIKKSFPLTASLGLMYSAITEWCGYSPASDEFKVMALSALAEPIHKETIRQQVLVAADGFTFNPEYFNFDDTTLPTYKQTFAQKFGPPLHRSVFENLHSPEARHACQVVASFQAILESVVCSDGFGGELGGLLNRKSLLLSGGVFLNTLLVSTLMRQRGELTTSVSPSPGDGGSSIGAAYYCSKVLGWEMQRKHTAFVGPRLCGLHGYDHLFRPLVGPNLVDDWIESFLSGGNVLPFFQGVAEIGPRSLGARSLICRIDQHNWLRNLNETTKRREQFRPIAPIMLNDDPAIEALCLSRSERLACRHMGTLVKATQQFLDIIGQAKHVLHVDSTLRLQLLSSKDFESGALHVSLYKILKEHRILANTSFNISGDPTVGTPLDCYINLRRMNLKFLAADDIVYEVI